MTVNVDYFFIWKQCQLHFRRFYHAKERTLEKNGESHCRHCVTNEKGPLQQMRKGSVQPSSEKYLSYRPTMP